MCLLQNALNTSNLKPCNRGCNWATLRGYASRTSRTSGSGSEGDRPVKETKVWTEQFLNACLALGEKLKCDQVDQVRLKPGPAVFRAPFGSFREPGEICGNFGSSLIGLKQGLSDDRSRAPWRKTSWIPLNWSFASWQVPFCIQVYTVYGNWQWVEVLVEQKM